MDKKTYWHKGEPMKGDRINPYSRRVYLTDDELDHALTVGKNRRMWGILRGKLYPGQTLSDIWLHDGIGAIGEKAVSVFTNIPWDGGGPEDQRYDVGKYQVRATNWFHGRCYFHIDNQGKDKLEDVFILATVSHPPEVMIRGWAYGHELAQDCYFGQTVEDRPAYQMPQYFLHPMKNIPIFKL